MNEARLDRQFASDGLRNIMTSEAEDFAYGIEEAQLLLRHLDSPSQVAELHDMAMAGLFNFMNQAVQGSMGNAFDDLFDKDHFATISKAIDAWNRQEGKVPFVDLLADEDIAPTAHSGHALTLICGMLRRFASS